MTDVFGDKTSRKVMTSWKGLKSSKHYTHVMPKSGQRSRKYGSKDSTKLRILSYLYSHSEGANQNTMNSLPGLNSQRWDIIKEILIELSSAGSILVENHDEIKKGAVIYKITQRGRQTVEKLREFREIGLDKTFDLFDGLTTPD